MHDRATRALGLLASLGVFLVCSGESCMGGAEMERSSGYDLAPDAPPTYSTAPTQAFSWFQLSPDDSTSMASAQLLKSGAFIWGYKLKPHEVLNYYDPPAALRSPAGRGSSWVVRPGLTAQVELRREVAASDSTLHRLQVLLHVFAEATPLEQRRPYNLHLCVDVSGSMSGDKLAFVREALQRLAEALRDGDRLSLTTFSTDGRLVLPSVEVGANRERIVQAIAALEVEGSTNMIEGLNLAYAQAQQTYDAAAINRVLLFSDGNANVGDTDIASFAALTRMNNQEGIYLSGVGVGTDYDMERMDRLTDAGKGAHVFLPDREEVEVIFGPMLRKLIEVAADEVSLELALPPSFRLENFSGEEVSVDPEHRVANVVLAAGDDLTMLATFVTEDATAFAGNLQFIFRYRPLSTASSQRFDRPVPLGDLGEAASPLMRRTQLVEAYARWGCTTNSQVDAAELVQQIEAFETQDPGLEEIRDILLREPLSMATP